MKILIKEITIVYPGTSHHMQKMDVLLEGSKIKTIQKKISSEGTDTVVEGKGKYLLPGLCDLYTSIPDPGNETTEDIKSGCKAALAGGFTDIFITANTNPPIQTKSIAEYIIKEGKNQAIRVHPIGAATENLTGNNPVEMYDLHKSGVTVFGNMPYSIQDSGVLVRTLQYTRPLGALLMEMPYDKNLTGSGQVNESIVSVKMGMKGIPEISEATAIQRAIRALEYAGGKLHLAGISTEEGVNLVKEAKKAGLHITASVFVHHLLFTEEEVSEYDTNFKVNPPLRSKSDQKALFKGLKEGVLDAICTQHTPVDTEGKDLEFEYAQFGMISLQTALSALFTHTSKYLSIEDLTTLLAINPRKITHLPAHKIEESHSADFILFDPEKTWTFSPVNNQSKSANSPFVGAEMKGAVTAVFTNNKLHKVTA